MAKKKPKTIERRRGGGGLWGRPIIFTKIKGYTHLYSTSEDGSVTDYFRRKK